MCIYPEGTIGDIDTSPGDDDGVFDGLRGNVDTEEGSVSVICHLDVDGETLRILKEQTPPQHLRSQCASLSTEEPVENTSADHLRTCLRTRVQKNPQPEDLVFADVSNVSSDVSGDDSELWSLMKEEDFYLR